MRAVIQRVKKAKVVVDGQTVAEIGGGLLLFVGAGRGDGPDDACRLAAKIARLRIFADDGGKMNRSLLDTGGEALVVSQFTLYADCSRGNRPGFDQAEVPAAASALIGRFAAVLAETGIPVQTGIFGADMAVSLLNDGPVTILLDSVNLR